MNTSFLLAIGGAFSFGFVQAFNDCPCLAREEQYTNYHSTLIRGACRAWFNVWALVIVHIIQRGCCFGHVLAKGFCFGNMDEKLVVKETQYN